MNVSITASGSCDMRRITTDKYHRNEAFFAGEMYSKQDMCRMGRWSFWSWFVVIVVCGENMSEKLFSPFRSLTFDAQTSYLPF